MIGIPRGRRGPEAQGSVITAEGGPATQSRKPLEPIASIVGFLLAVMAALTLLSACVIVFGNGTSTVSFLGLGRSAAPTVTVPVIELRGATRVYGWDVRPEVFVQPSDYRLDITAPDVAQRIWYTLAGLSSLVLYVGGLLLARRIIGRARRDGIFTLATARGLRSLGWFLVGGSLVGMVVSEVANNRLLATMVTNHVGWITFHFWHVPWAMLIFGGTLLSIARVMRIGVEMNDELSSTV